MMSNHLKRAKPKHNKVPKSSSKTTIAALTALAVILVVVVFVWWRSKHSVTQVIAPPTQAGSNQDTAITKMVPDLGRLDGKWLRPDGGYILEIKTVSQSDKIEASYFNPQPIHVSKAAASRDGNSIKVFVELRDVNYPGSTYDLTYVPEIDQLKGVYYHAALKQNFEVVFFRMK